MSNLMTQIYIGHVEEIIYKDGKPTLELRVRVPTMHGQQSSYGVPTNMLPIAKPMFTLGNGFNYTLLEETLKSLSKVFVIFESGNLSKPIYFGMKGNEDLFNTPGNIAFIYFYETKEDFPETGEVNYIYWDQDEDVLYYYDVDSENYVPFAGSGFTYGNLILYATSEYSGIETYGSLVVSNNDTRYDDPMYEAETGTITGQAVACGQLVSDANILTGTVQAAEVTTRGNIAKVAGNTQQFSSFYFEIYQLKEEAEVLLGTSSNTSSVNPENLDVYHEFSASVVIPETTWLATDRLLLKFYADLESGSSDGGSYKFQFGGSGAPVRTIMPVPLSSIPDPLYAVTDLTSGNALNQYVATADGAGNVTWEIRGNKNYLVSSATTPDDEGYTTVEGDLWFEYIE